MTYTATHSTATLTDAHAALDRASQTLDRLEQRMEERRRRSLALARAAALGPFSVIFRSLEVGRDGWPTRVVVEAPSASLPLVRYRVEVDLRSASATCSCVAGSFGKSCKHAGSGLLYGACVVQAYREAQAEYAAQIRDEGNAAAIAPSL